MGVWVYGCGGVGVGDLRIAHRVNSIGGSGKSKVVWPLVQWMALAGLLLALVACSSPSPSPTLPPSPSSTVPPTPAPTDDVPSTAEVMEPAATESSPAAPQHVKHTVQPGETLLQLALQYGVPMAAIQLQNDLGSATALQAGQVLGIPPAAEWEGASPFWVVYEVVEGATLSGIAASYDLDLTTLRAVNGLADDDLLWVGQLLILPLDTPAEVARASTPTPTPVPPTSTPAPTTESTASPPTSTTEPLPTEVAAWAAEVFRLINGVRAEHGLPPYAYNETLERAAQLHGQDCQQRGSCSHTGSDGSNVKTRILRAGYDAAGWAECIVYSWSPQEAVDWWMDETPPNDPHRRTLLSTWVTEIGIAVVPTDRGYYYFIADFGRPKTP
jgi:uncharacterized protein YkwD